MNLIGHRFKSEKITLDKINRCLREEAKKSGYLLKIIQTNNEAIASTYIQKQRNKVFGIILFPGPWQNSGFIIKDTIELLSIPFITVSIGENTNLLKGAYNIKEKDLYKSCELSILNFSKLI